VSKCAIVISDPKSDFTSAIRRAGVDCFICVRVDRIYTIDNDIITTIKSDELTTEISISIPDLRNDLLKMYPLIDRWVSNRVSISDTIEACLVYTCSLIKIIATNKNCFAILETGAPHHLFTYCLHTALKYLKIPTYYLYPNGIDQSLNIFRGIEKLDVEIEPQLDRTSSNNIQEYVSEVLSDTKFVPKDSSYVLKSKSNRSSIPVFIQHTKVLINRALVRKKQHAADIYLELPELSLREVFNNLRKQKRYLKNIKAKTSNFDISQISSTDIVYVGHMLPEATSFPDSINYPGEIDVLLDLRNRFPNSIIFYKEHPAINVFSEVGHIHQQGLHKNTAFLKLMDTLNINFIPIDLHMSELRAVKCLFATKTGRVAIENSIKSSKTIIYGYPFYGINLPMTAHVSSLKRYDDVNELTEQIKISSPEKVVEYLSNRFNYRIINPGIGIARQADAITYPHEIEVLMASLLTSCSDVG